jgi:hypothetical protein
MPASAANYIDLKDVSAFPFISTARQTCHSVTLLVRVLMQVRNANVGALAGKTIAYFVRRLCSVAA